MDLPNTASDGLVAVSGPKVAVTDFPDPRISRLIAVTGTSDRFQGVAIAAFGPSDEARGASRDRKARPDLTPDMDDAELDGHNAAIDTHHAANDEESAATGRNDEAKGGSNTAKDRPYTAMQASYAAS